MSGPSTPGNNIIITPASASSPSSTSTPTPATMQSAPLVPLGDTLSNLTTIGTSIDKILKTIPSSTPNKQALASTVQTSIAGTQDLLAGLTQVGATTKACVDGLYRRLQDVHAHLQDRHVYGRRAQIKRDLKALIGRPQSPNSTYHLDIQAAFEAVNVSTNLIEAVPALPSTSPTQATHQTTTDTPSVTPPVPEPSAPEPSSAVQLPKEEAATETTTQTGPTEAPKKSTWRTTAVDGLEISLRILSDTTAFMPPMAGSIVKLMAGTGLTIITMLRDLKENNEQAMELGRHIGTLIQTAALFLEGSEPGTEEDDDEQTTARLRSFLDALNALAKSITGFKEQGRLRQGISHNSNKDDLKKWDTTINRAFVTLQTQLSLHSVRILTNLRGADANRERDRLIGLLGDGDTGATEKAADPEDLMCLPGTRAAILGQVDDWIEEPSGSRVLWISGVAGCGKSAVAATIAGRKRDPLTSTAIFHFARANQGRNKRVVCSFSRQLARFSHGSLEQFVLGAVKANPDIATSHITTQFCQLIVEPLKKLAARSPPVIIVLDALDEWDNHDAAAKLVELIRQADAELPRTVRFVVTSRNEHHLTSALERPSMRSLVERCQLDTVQRTETTSDIRSFVEMRFSRIRDHLGIDEGAWPKEGSVEKLVELSGGLFQWASTAMTYIATKSPETRLDETLDSPQTYVGLDSLYRGILAASFRDETRPHIQALIKNVLGSLLTAVTPIGLNTLAYLCCDNIKNLPKTTKVIRDEILVSLGSLLLIPENPDQPITVAHPSVIDFLTDPVRCPNQLFNVDVVAHQTRLLSACFYMMDRDLKQDICEIGDPSKANDEVQDKVAERISSGLRYVCQHWGTHLVHCGHGASAELCQRLAEFTRKHLLHWLEVMSLIGVMINVIPVTREVGHWLSDCSSLSPIDVATQRLCSDGGRFVALYFKIISEFAAHIYISAIHLVPSETELALHFSTSVRGLRVLRGLVERQWWATVWTARGHTHSVRCVAFSSDGRKIVTGSDDFTLRLWDADSGASKAEALVGHTGFVSCLMFSPDGKMIASGSWDYTLRLWDADSGASKAEPFEGHTSCVSCLAFSPNGKMIASGSWDCTLRLWDVSSGASKAEPLVGHTKLVRCLMFSPDGRTIASGSFDQTLRLWDADSGASKAAPLLGHTSGVSCLMFSPDGRTIASGSYDRTLRLWDANSGASKAAPLVGHMGTVSCLMFSPDGRMIVSGSWDGALRVWDADSGASRAEPLVGHTDYVSCLMFSPDGRMIASGSGDTTLRLWNADSGASMAEPFVGHTDSVNCLMFSPDGRMIASGSDDETLRLWDADSGASKPAPPVGHVSTVSYLKFSLDGRMIASGSDDGTLRLWDADSGASKAAPLVGHTGRVSCLMFSPDRRMIASGSRDNTLRLWDADSGASKTEPLVGHTEGVTCLTFSPDGRMIASGSYDKTLRLWDTDSGASKAEPLVGHTGRVSCLMFSPDGRTIASGSFDRTLRLWDADSGASKAAPLLGHASDVSCLMFSPDGRTIASGSYDRTLRLWDANSGASKAAPLVVTISPLNSLSFSADGGTITVKDILGSTCDFDVAAIVSPYIIFPTDAIHRIPYSNTPILEGWAVKDGWIYYNDLRWIWLPNLYQRAHLLLCGARLAVGTGRELWIVDVSEVLYIVENRV